MKTEIRLVNARLNKNDDYKPHILIFNDNGVKLIDEGLYGIDFLTIPEIDIKDNILLKTIDL